MKIPSALLFCALLAAGRAAPLTQTAAVQTQPDPSAPVLAYLKAGSEPPAAAADAPAGWLAVQVPGPVEGYVLDSDLTKGLEVKPGSSVRLEPKPDAGVLTVAAKGDKSEITGLYGKWTKVRLDKGLVGYVQLAPQAPATPAPLVADAPASPPAPAGPGRAVEADPSQPTYFEGQFVASPRPLIGRRPPFSWQLDDASGARFAYLDLAKLLLTDQIESYLGRPVIVSGKLAATPGGRDLVIAVESLRLR